MRNLDNHRIVSKDEWLAARGALLKKEKEFTLLREKLGQQQRDMPWVLVDKEYLFDGPNGKQTLSELFDGRSQLYITLCMILTGTQDVRLVLFGLTILME